MPGCLVATALELGRQIQFIYSIMWVTRSRLYSPQVLKLNVFFIQVRHATTSSHSLFRKKGEMRRHRGVVHKLVESFGKKRCSPQPLALLP
jgi:hypothetical protein